MGVISVNELNVIFQVRLTRMHTYIMLCSVNYF